MVLVRSFFQSVRTPWGVPRTVMLRFMNFSHAPLTNCGLSLVEIHDDSTMLDIGCDGEHDSPSFYTTIWNMMLFPLEYQAIRTGLETWWQTGKYQLFAIWGKLISKDSTRNATIPLVEHKRQLGAVKLYPAIYIMCVGIIAKLAATPYLGKEID